jgi:hypothetical protein
MNIFANLKLYASKWSVTNSREFTPEEISSVTNAVVVSSEYGNSVQFAMAGGGMTFIPLSQDSTLTVGEVVDLNKARLLTLSKSGEADIFRVEI